MSRFSSLLRSQNWGRLLRTVFGTLSYQPPNWLRNGWLAIWGQLQRKPWTAAGALAVLVLAGFGIRSSLGWWEAHKPRPKPVVEIRELAAKLKAPGVTPIVNGKPVPEPIILEFSSSAAPAEAVGKPVTTGIDLVPATKGQWSWISDKTLAFHPEADWPAGVDYQVALTGDPPPAARFKETEWRFVTAPFAPGVATSEFYTDPENPSIHQVVAEFQFSHPVTKSEVERHVMLNVLGKTPVFQAGGKAPDHLFEVAEGDHQRQFWVRTARIAIPEKEDFLEISLTPGLASSLGGKAIEKGLTAKVRIPDVTSGFSLKETTTGIVRTAEGDPEQFLFLETDGFVAGEELEQHLSVWLLPKDKPANAQGPAVEDYQWPEPGEVTPAVLGAARKVPCKRVESEKAEGAPVATLHAFKVQPSGAGRLFVRVSAGVNALGGFRLGSDYAAVADVPQLPKEVEILGKGGLLALNGEHKLGLKYRGVQHLRITLGRVPFNQLNHLARLTGGDFASPYWKTDFDEENIARFHREVREVAMPNDWQANYTNFDFAAALASQDSNEPDTSRGLFFFSVEGVRSREPDPDESDPALSNWEPAGGSASDNRFILLTDLGILMKRNADSSRGVFVQSFSKGEPAPAGVNIITLAKNGEFLHQTATDAQGHAQIPSLEHLRRERLPVCVIARQGNDVAFLPFRRPDRLLDFSRFDTGGVMASEQAALDGFLFTERGVYRPGDLVHVGGVVKRRDWQGKLEGLPLVLEVHDAKDDLLTEQDLVLAGDGFLDAEVKTAEESPTGTYAAYLYVLKDAANPSDRILLSRASFRVEDFQPDRMKLALNFSVPTAPGWIQAGEVKATVNLQTLFGMPAENRRVKAKLALHPGAFAFEKFPGFTFHNRLEKEAGEDSEAARAGQEVDLGEQATDGQGNAEFNLALERFSDGVFQAEFFAEGFEADGGRSVRGAQAMLIAPLPYVVGWKADGDLGYIGKDAPRNLKLLAIDPALSPLTLPGLKLRIVEVRHLSVLTKQRNGSFAYVSTARERTVREETLALAKEGGSVALPSSQPGEFRFELEDQDGHRICAVPYSVVGSGDGGRSLERDAELEMKLARSELKGGEELEFGLRAPFTGAGLATIERDKVLSWLWLKQTTPDATHRIAVPAGLEGTGYLNVAFVRALDSPEVFTSPLSYAVAPFQCDVDKRRMTVELDVPKLVRPGSKLVIGYKSSKPGRVAIYAVDEGILQVTDYRLPDPLKHFNRKRSLEVESEQILDLILPEFSMLSKQKAYGGSDDVALKMHLNPFKRRKEAPVVFWSGLLACGTERQETSYEVPDYFAGSLKVMAVAVGEDAIGTTQGQCTARGPFVLTPNAPFFASPGDEFVASLTVANNLSQPGAPGTVAVKAEASEQLELVPPADRNVDVTPGKEATVRFRVRVKDALGGAELRFQVAAGGESATRSTTLSVRPASPFATEVQSGYFRLGRQSVGVRREMYPQFRKAEAMVSTAPLGLARGLEAYLHDYPHGCSEQITSRAMSRLLLADEADFGFDKADAVDQMNGAFALLRARQHSNGGFGYWDGFCDARPDFLSVYVTGFLVEARDAGYAVPSELFDAARVRMKEIARAKTASLDEAAIQAAAIYLLTRGGEVTTNLLLNLRDTLEKQFKEQWEPTLAAAYLASSYTLLKQEKEGQSLMELYRRKAGIKASLERWRGDWWTDPRVRNAQAFALTCRHFPDIAKRFGYDDLAVITEPIARHQFNTISSATSIQALKAYSALAKAGGAKASIVELPRKGGENRTLAGPASGFLHAALGEEAGSVRFELERGDGDFGAFYQVVEAGFSKGAAADSVANGLEVFRDLLGPDDKPLGTIRIGQSVTVKLRIRNVSPENQANVAVVDLLPGSFEVEQGSLRPGRNTIQGADFVDMREDRNVFFTNIRKGEMQTFSYRMKPTAAGSFVVPAVYAEAMYEPSYQGRSGGGKIVVEIAEAGAVP